MTTIGKTLAYVGLLLAASPLGSYGVDRRENPNLESIVNISRGYETRNAVSRTYFGRFNEFKDLFLTCSQNPPRGWTQEEFMALLAAVSQQESSMGYPNGKEKDPTFLMGYDTERNLEDDYRCAEKQIGGAAETLRAAIDGENPRYPGTNTLKKVLSVYYRGKVNEQGLKYAESVVDYYNSWRDEFEE